MVNAFLKLCGEDKSYMKKIIGIHNEVAGEDF